MVANCEGVELKVDGCFLKILKATSLTHVEMRKAVAVCKFLESKKYLYIELINELREAKTGLLSQDLPDSTSNELEFYSTMLKEVKSLYGTYRESRIKLTSVAA